jgi:hypothetical protein
MKLTGRIRMFFGIIIVILIVGCLALYLDGIMSMAQSFKAELDANAVSIGTDYPGLVVKQNVEEGDKVTKGEILFEIQSTQLNQDLSDKAVSASSLSFSVDPTTNYIELKAGDDGIVQKISYRAGSYVPGGNIVATIDTLSSLYVTASFHLSPPDYARINKANQLSLIFPDNSTKKATIYSIALVPDGDGVDTVVKAHLVNADTSDFEFSVGTPVHATLQLSQAKWYQGLTNDIEQLFKPLGR